MVKKLTFLLTKQITWKLLFKAFFYGIILFWLTQVGFGFWPVFLFFLVAILIYFSEKGSSEGISFSFWFLFFLSLVFLELNNLYKFEGVWNFFTFFINSPFIVIFWSGLLFLWLGLNQRFFNNRFLVFNIFKTLLVITAYIFYYLLPQNFFFAVGLMLLIGLSFREDFVFFGFLSKKIILGGSYALAFLVFQVGWFIAFLPLGFLNSAALLTLFTAISRDLFIVRERGLLNRTLVFEEAAFFTILMVIIFAFSSWTV
ncbi:MAG: hypothetical protein AAB432_00700 [Patescibacteria group bacterium]